MNILFVHEVDWLRKVVYDVHMLAEAMSLRGHEVYALDYESMWERNGASPREMKVSRVFDGAFVELVRPYFIKLPVVSRVSAFVSHYFALEQLIVKKGIDAIILYSVPTNGLQAVYLANKYGIPIIFRSLDIVHRMVPVVVLDRITKVMEKAVYSRVHMGLTITPRLSDYIESLGAKHTQVLPIPVDTKSFYPFKSRIGAKWGITEDDKVILFMGTVFRFSGLVEFIKELPHLLYFQPKVKLLIVGDGEQRKQLELLICRMGLEGKVIITGFLPYEEMPDYINMACVCINPFRPNAITKDIFPGKTVQYLACGKPLVMTRLAGVEALIDGDKQGVLYATEVGTMINNIIGLLENPQRCKELGDNALAYACQYHDCSKVAERLEGILDEQIKR